MEEARAAWSDAAKSKRKVEHALGRLQQETEQAAAQKEQEYRETYDEVVRDYEEQQQQVRETRKRLHTVELEISEMRGRTTHLAKEQFLWEQDMREKWEAEEQALVSERKALLQRRLPSRRRVEEQPSEARLLTCSASAAAAAADASSSSAPAAPAAPSARAEEEWKELVLAINLDRRPDRLEALTAHDWGDLSLERMAAVDGKKLEWDALVRDGHVTEEGAKEARYTEAEQLPTICRHTSSFSPHLTLAAVGCALSHRRAWERIAKQSACEWGLVLEDDVSGVAPNFANQLRHVVRRLPRTWAICYLGYHESDNSLIPSGGYPVMKEVQAAQLTGLFGYVVTRAAATELLADRALFPLRHQIDVALSKRNWPRGSRFALKIDEVLLTSPRSEDGACDTDVQTLGPPGVDAHANLPADMLANRC